jgi:3'-phosphoadenosine 5'-phosphosulfate (PAPS) 3'-phosphatase
MEWDTATAGHAVLSVRAVMFAFDDHTPLTYGKEVSPTVLYRLRAVLI